MMARGCTRIVGSELPILRSVSAKSEYGISKAGWGKEEKKRIKKEGIEEEGGREEQTHKTVNSGGAAESWHVHVKTF